MTGNVGIVIVSHSVDVARGTADMVRQMVGEEVPLAFCGGNADGGLGTDVQSIMNAIDTAWSAKGGQTELALTATALALAPVGRQMIVGMRAGWSQSLLKLDSLVTDALDREIVMTRCIDAPREMVWKAFPDPKQVYEEGFVVIRDGWAKA